MSLDKCQRDIRAHNAKQTANKPSIPTAILLPVLLPVALLVFVAAVVLGVEEVMPGSEGGE